MRGGVLLAAGAMLPLMMSERASGQDPGTPVHYRAVPLEGPMPPQNPADSTFDVLWATIDSGGTTMSGSGGLELGCTTGQPDAGQMSGGTLFVTGGFWPLPESVSCYANCDGSSLAPILNINDFQCFMNLYAAQDPRANCDNSSSPPVLNVNDFQCFLNTYAVGCS